MANETNQRQSIYSESSQVEWTLLDKNDNTLLDITSFLEIDGKYDATVVSESIEEGSFSTYNKTIAPRTWSIKIAKQGKPDEIQALCDKLEDLRVTTTVFTLVTPYTEVKNITLESFDNKNTNQDGCYLFVANLSCIEVIESKINSGQQKSKMTSSNVKNPSDASKVDKGRKKAENQSVLYHLFGGKK